MRLTMVLADGVVERGGKLDFLGVGWQMGYANFSGMVVGLVFEVPWADASEEWHSLEVTVSKRVPDGSAAVEAAPLWVLRKDQAFKARAGAALTGSPIRGASACPVPPMRLDPFSRYTVRVKIDGETEDDWTQDFYTLGED